MSAFARLCAAAAAALALGSPALAEVDITDVTSPGGIHAWLVEEHSLPFVSLEIRFKGGASLDADGKRGAINLMTGLLEEGAADLDAQGFAEAKEAIATSIGFRPRDDSIAVSAQFLTETRDEAAELLRKSLVEPRFDAAAIERVKGQVISGIQSDAQDPQAIAGRTFDATVFADSPYGSSRDGTVASVGALTRDDLVAAKDRALARDRVYVSAVGDIDAATLGELLDHVLGGLPATGAPMPPPVEPAFEGGVTTVPFETPQSVIAFGQPGIPREDPDFFAAYLLNDIVGGSRFGSRLMTEVREKRGLTYGVSTYLLPLDLAAIWMGNLASANASAGEAIEVIRDQWARAAKEGVTQAELDAAKTYQTGSFPLNFSGNGSIADILVGFEIEGLPIDYARTRNERIDAVTLADVNRVAARLMQPEKLRFIVVGEPEGLPAGN